MDPNCRHRNLEYHSTQLLIGHGSYRTLTKKIGKDDVDTYVYCGGVDTPDHRCDRWVKLGQPTNTKTGITLNPGNTVEPMIQDKNDWNKVHSMIRSIMFKKEEEERIKQSERIVVE
ncbi:hypothetical protein JTB14_032787 [Gonioctena quinquepunctata]|nr:hypothetical protein JTB14_032787 [Gonioctena quinquepunctata]